MIAEGQPIPPGAIWDMDGWNFAFYSWHATGVTWLLNDRENFVEPAAVLQFDPQVLFEFWQQCIPKGYHDSLARLPFLVAI
jgi:pullulanase/glycogen debranching enzyme